MKETQYETILRVIGSMFIVLLTSIVNASNHTKCISLSNLHPNEYSQELHHYRLAVKVDRYVGSYTTLNDLSNKVCSRKDTKFKYTRF